MLHWILKSSSAVHKRQATSSAPFLRSPGFPPQHYHQAPGTLYSPSGLAAGQWTPWPIGDKQALLGQRRGRDIAPRGAEYSFCASWAGAQWTGRGRGPWRPLALASGAGPGCWPHLAGVLRAGAAAAAAAGRRHGPGLPARRVPASAPRRPVSATAAGPGPTPATRSPRRTGPRYVGRSCTHSWLCPASAYFLNIQPTLPQ